MQGLSSLRVVLLMFVTYWLQAQSPHGPQLTIDCKKCHSPESWAYLDSLSSFSHDSTSFSLEGRHAKLDCRSCHTSLIFEEVKTDCNSCHADIHQGSVGQTCNRCHTADSWIVSNISELHEQTSFPLIGVHKSIDCKTCHTSATDLQFNAIGIQCINCHREDFKATTNPNHIANNFSNNCAECHSIFEKDWKTSTINHDFFPLTKGHDIKDCKACHSTSNYSDVSNACVSCHKDNFDATKSPNHLAAGFDNDCVRCHTTEPSWRPARYAEHDAVFPIYTGAHAKKWLQCIDCHDTPNDFTQTTCVSCHKNPDTDEEHKNVGSYLYQDQACLACHPKGDADNPFDHEKSNFPLTGAHRALECLACHISGYKGTPTECAACHQIQYNAASNPNHKNLGLSTDCKSCHTTEAGWAPARFDVHNQYYVLQDAHAVIKNDCKVCHNGDYTNTPNTCMGCHSDDFNNAINPNHKAANFPNDCAQCHGQKAWVPSTFDHDGLYFPIYSGKHKAVWNNCIACHTNPNDYSINSCTVCHINPETDQEHTSVNGYIYQDNACLACHPSGDADITFNHDLTGFPLTGAHIQANCLECHANGFKNTPSECAACHQNDFNQTINPNHSSLGLSTDCKTCHSTTPGWEPAGFGIHNQFYVLRDAHAIIKDDCKACHNGNYNNTPNTCVGCHWMDYDGTLDPNHKKAQFPTECASCHTEKAWVPAIFDHDVMFFPIYSGKHKGVWTECIDCHTNQSNYKEYDCLKCHMNPETDNEHVGVQGYVYVNNACFGCHPTGDADFKFDHNATSFSLNGAHIQVNCLDCHTQGFKNTPTECIACHQIHFEQAINPNHKKLNFSTDCIQCHNTAPDWTPALFNDHNTVYVLDGAHGVIKNNCAACHNGDYNNTPNTCAGCHQTDFNNTLNPNHQALGISTDCISCHTTTPGWAPATFDVHDNYYVLKGVHGGIKNDCGACHNGNYSNTPNTCYGCHKTDYENTMSPDHGSAQFPTDCAACHNESAWTPSIFDHDGMYFPIFSGKHKMTWTNCNECHQDPTNYKLFTCVTCHMNPETNDDHAGIGGYIYQSYACLGCHPTGEKSLAFDHNTSQFPLTGAHVVVDCKECHINGFKNTPLECKECHQSDYNSATNPSHINLGLPLDCISCHTTAPGWSPAKFDIHDNYYVLTGAHLAIKNNCTECHIGGDYNTTPTTCVGCHQSDFNGSTNPNHPALGIPQTCDDCHSTNAGWSPASFAIHDNYYVLTGAHLTIKDNCIECHIGGNYNNTPNTCVGCHQADYNGSTNPPHVALNFPQACNDCHTTNPGWSPATFGIHDNYYPLTGAHAAIANNCTECHIGGNYNNTPNTCVGCHLSDFNGSTNPNHPALNIPQTCNDCHSTNPGWSPATFGIHDNYYALTGAHATIANNCTECHIGGNYNNTPNTCVGCHLSNFNGSTNPNHPALNIPQTCDDCHTTNPGWAPATFDIHNNYYQLIGAHATIADNCVVCHNGNYNNTPNTCYACHDDDYNGTNNPDHQSAQFPTDCILCHNQSSWTPSTFDHDNMYFPIFSGRHDNEWNLCSDCHTGNNYNIFNCLGCHEQNETNDQHQGVTGYQYNSGACYSCHPDGED